MSISMPPLVQETTTTTGTGTYTLSGTAPTGRQTFANAAADGQITTGDQVHYMVIDASGGPPDFEHGLGTWTSAGNTLTRDVILRSSNAGSAVSWGVGTRDIYIVGPQPAEKPVRTLVALSADQSVAGLTTQAVNWETEYEDTAGAWAVSPNPNRITVPTGYTRARFIVQAAWQYIALTTALWVQIYKNASYTVPGLPSVVSLTNTSVNSSTYQQLASGDLSCVGGDYFEVMVTNIGATARNLLAGSGTGTWVAATFWRE